MQAMPITSTDLGLKQTQRQCGYGLIAAGSLVSLMALIRFLTLESPGGLEWTAIWLVGLFGLRRLYVGVHLLLDVFVDSLGPADIQNAHAVVKELLWHRRIWTYQRPNGLVEKIYYHFVPAFVFLTPPYRRLVIGIVPHLLLTVAAAGGFVYVGMPAVLPLLLLLAAGFGRGIALWNATRASFAAQPPVDVYERPEHLTKAGSPVDLYSHIKRTLEQLREGEFQNRTLHDRSPQMGMKLRQRSFRRSLPCKSKYRPDVLCRRRYLLPWRIEFCQTAFEYPHAFRLLFAVPDDLLVLWIVSPVPG